MYAAKERGKDRYAEFEDEMRTAAGLRLEAKEVVRQHKTCPRGWPDMRALK